MSLRASQAASLLLLGLLSPSASAPASGCCSKLRLKQLCLLRSGGPRSLTLTAEAVRELDLGLEETWRQKKDERVTTLLDIEQRTKSDAVYSGAKHKMEQSY